MNIINFSDFFLNESRLYLYTRKFDINALIKSGLYDIDLITKWRKDFNFDEDAKAIFISKNPINNKTKLKIDTIEHDIKNKYFLNDNTISNMGYIIEDSLLCIEKEIIYLYIFKYGSNSDLRTRANQSHGFDYEDEMIDLNKLKTMIGGHKWDAFGKLDINFIDKRIEEGRSIELWDGREYIDPELVELLNLFNTELYWNIKKIKQGASIDMSDFKRISGLKLINNKLVKDDDNIEEFIFNVALYNDNGVTNEYIIIVDIENWIKYLPNIEENLFELENMYSELKNWKLDGDREDEIENEWYEWYNKYRSISDESIIKLRFKRDTKGQIRVQGAIPYGSLMKVILKENIHIKIS